MARIAIFSPGLESITHPEVPHDPAPGFWHTFRATGITAYLKNGGKLEVAQQMAAHESERTTDLYDRRCDEISLDEVEQIVIWAVTLFAQHFPCRLQATVPNTSPGL
jgi:hypothetical protein